MLEIKIVIHNDGKVTVASPGSNDLWPARTYTDLGRAFGKVSVVAMNHQAKMKAAKPVVV
jgi:hypothetical protein